jgi:hypothetical protein
VIAGPEDSELPGLNEAPGHEAVAAALPDPGGLRASHADREQVIGGLKTAFVQGRLTEEELAARAGQVYASRTYAELAGVTADLPEELTGRLGIRSRRNPWRATKIAWRVEYAVVLPGIVTLLLIPGGPRTSVAEVVILASVVYFLFWFLGIGMMITSRPAKPALEDHEHLHASHAVARDHVVRVLGAALAQGRLTEEEHDERLARQSDSRCWTDLDALIADLPAGLAAQPPRARDVRIGAGVSAAAASVFAAIALWQPDNPLGFMLGLLAFAILLVAPVITVGLLADVRHQKRSGRQQRSRRRR